MLFSDQDLKTTLSQCRSIAVVGAKDTPGSAVDMVGRYLISAGFMVYPVHPVRKNIWGLPTYPSLADVPHAIDLIDLFRSSEFCPAHAKETLALANAPKVFWMQSGIYSYEARQLLSATAMTVIEDRCLMVEHRRLFSN